MQRVIVTGANGAGKSHVAKRLQHLRPEIPLISFDAIKLTIGWQQRARADIDTELSAIVARDAWVLEGGQSLLPRALPRAEAVIWLDPPERVRVWRLFSRPWRNFGKTRSELPSGNVDWPIEQYRFALRSMRKRAKVRTFLASNLAAAEHQIVWQCQNETQVDVAVNMWGKPDN